MSFTSESVTSGHPDKICDQIADAILDDILSKDKKARVACEVSVSRGLVHVFGEITTSCYSDFDKIARNIIKNIGYNNNMIDGFNSDTCGIIVSVGTQSEDIALGVDSSYEATDDIGAGDQGMMFGFACDETDELMPMSILLAHKLSRRLEVLRKDNIVDFLRPDGKTQVTVEYENGKPSRISNIVVSCQHSSDISNDKIKKEIKNNVVFSQIPSNMIDSNTNIFINPTGRFTIGGPIADSGLTGRKIMVDTYGGFSRHGGGAFSGKDPTKVDRSGAYMARYVAKNIVAANIAKMCEVRFAYAIGGSKPLSVFVETFGTSKFSNEIISEKIKKIFDFRPSAIIKNFDLLNVKYMPLASYGHMGRTDLNYMWELTDKSEELKEFF